MIKELAETFDVTTDVFDKNYYRSAEHAFERIGRGRHPVALNIGDCFSCAVATIAKAPLLFKGQDFGRQILSFILRLR